MEYDSILARARDNLLKPYLDLFKTEYAIKVMKALRTPRLSHFCAGKYSILKRQTGYTSQKLSRVCRKLAQYGLVQIRGKRRSIRYRLTDSGKQVLEAYETAYKNQPIQ